MYMAPEQFNGTRVDEKVWMRNPTAVSSEKKKTLEMLSNMQESNLHWTWKYEICELRHLIRGLEASAVESSRVLQVDFL